MHGFGKTERRLEVLENVSTVVHDHPLLAQCHQSKLALSIDACANYRSMDHQWRRSIDGTRITKKLITWMYFDAVTGQGVPVEIEGF